MMGDILKGYLSFLKKILNVLTYLGGAVFVSVIVVLPFWVLASKKPGLFSFIAALLFLALAGVLIAVRIKSAERLRKRRREGKRTAAGAMLKAGLLVFLAAGLYGITLLITRGFIAAAIPGILVYLFILGYGFYAVKKAKKA